MPVVQNNIHYIWVGSPIPDAPQAEQAAKWILENPLYTFYLWGEKAHITENILRLQRNLERHVLADRIQHLSIVEQLQGPDLTITPIAGQPYTVHSRPISLLPSIGNTSIFMHEELTEWKNYGAASDLLRIWALHAFGGIYMDFDIYSNCTPLPLDIEAPVGILLGNVSGNLGLGLVNSIMAAPKQSPILIEFCDAIEENYTDEYIAGNNKQPAHYGFTGQKRHETLQQVREDLRNTTDPTERESLKKVIKELISVHTIMRTGPQMLIEWAHQKWEQENHPDPYWNDIMPGDFMCYDFAAVTGYPIRIEFENTWIK